MTLRALVERVLGSKGIAHKVDIRSAYAGLGDAQGRVRVGDDTAAIADGDGYLLFAIEGLLEEFVEREPWFAGYCGVMVNLSDVAAMGGRPIAVVDALWSASAERAVALWAGMRAASAAYGVPIVGGHTNVRAAGERLAVAVLGRANALVTSFDARPGDVVLAAIDLRGAYFEPYPYWNCSTTAPAEGLRGDLELLAEIAEAGLCAAAKDISMGGLLGTLLMLLEASGVGACVDLAAIPRPPEVSLERWLGSFPSFGYLLAVTPAHVDAVLRRFARRGIACEPIGTCTAEPSLAVERGAEREIFWNLAETPFTGSARAHAVR
ncbi:MAG: methanogenesis marker 2 protein [Vulcanimicrobiaceae bacterium]